MQHLHVNIVEIIVNMFSSYKARGVKLVGSVSQLRIPHLKEPFSPVCYVARSIYQGRGSIFLTKRSDIITLYLHLFSMALNKRSFP